MRHSIPVAKRTFDIVIGIAMVLVVLPVALSFALAVAVLEGLPVLYKSKRRIGPGEPEPIFKFRTMRRNADRVANRDTIPVQGVRFLNMPIDSPLYTPVGRLIERLMLTEMPQLMHVLVGRMSIVGNRPLPQNVVDSLREEFHYVEDRFLVPCGLTGPVQLIGRDFVSDADRLRIEIAYCRAVLNSYSVLLDLRILACTILRSLSARFHYTPVEVVALISSHDRPALGAPVRSGGALVPPAAEEPVVRGRQVSP